MSLLLLLNPKFNWAVWDIEAEQQGGGKKRKKKKIPFGPSLADKIAPPKVKDEPTTIETALDVDDDFEEIFWIFDI